MKQHNLLSWLAGCGLLLTTTLAAQNPIIRNQYSADPSARVFHNRVYLYPSHDILAIPGKGRPGWFCMEDYHVFSSDDLVQWKDHGVIVRQDNVPWVKPGGYSMWAPDCVARNGKYYFYFPAVPRDTSGGKGFAIGVAVADRPEGPFIPQAVPIQKVRGIDPNVLIDRDGQAYLYWSAGNIYAARLKANMLELEGEPVILGNLPDKGLKEGPYVFEREGRYYLTYPHVADKTERLEYAMGDHPLGPFTVTGVLMDESPTGCWTNHHSVVPFQNQWYLFYHHNDYSPQFDKARSVRADSLFFEADGTIRKVLPTWRGIGVTPARSVIEVDRYSAASEGVRLQFLDTANRFAGWEAVLPQPGAWIQYNTVSFSKKVRRLLIRAAAPGGATLVVRLGGPAGRVIATVPVPGGNKFIIVKKDITVKLSGIQHLVVQLEKNGPAQVDWLRFE